MFTILNVFKDIFSLTILSHSLIHLLLLEKDKNDHQLSLDLLNRISSLFKSPVSYLSPRFLINWVHGQLEEISSQFLQLWFII